MIAAVAASLAVVATFAVIAAALRRATAPAAVSPVLVTALAVGAVLAATHTPVARFATLTAPLHLLLGPAIVALAANVHAHRRALGAAAAPFALAVAAGSMAGVASAAALARLLGLGPLLAAATTTRTVSSAFAIVIHTRTGGPAGLAAGLAVATGVIGAVVVPPLLRLAGVRDGAALGTAAGVAAHLVGTDAVGRRDAVAGSFAGAALVGTGVLVALIVPPLWPWLAG